MGICNDEIGRYTLVFPKEMTGLRGLLGYRVKIYLDLDRRVRLHRSGILGESKIGLSKILGVYITRRGANSGLTL